jgi:hypothetical protein
MPLSLDSDFVDGEIAGYLQFVNLLTVCSDFAIFLEWSYTIWVAGRVVVSQCWIGSRTDCKLDILVDSSNCPVLKIFVSTNKVTFSQRKVAKSNWGQAVKFCNFVIVTGLPSLFLVSRRRLTMFCTVHPPFAHPLFETWIFGRKLLCILRLILGGGWLG